MFVIHDPRVPGDVLDRGRGQTELENDGMGRGGRCSSGGGCRRRHSELVVKVLKCNSI